jgi:hypothetical protein
MKNKSIFYAIFAMILVACGAFFAGLHWKDHQVGVQLTGALGTQLVCVANGLQSDVAVGSLLDKEDSSDAKKILATRIKSSVTKLKAFEPYLNKGDQAMVKDALQDGETYLSVQPSH